MLFVSSYLLTRGAPEKTQGDPGQPIEAQMLSNRHRKEREVKDIELLLQGIEPKEHRRF